MNWNFAVPFARNQHGQFVDVDQVPSGAGCNCVCDACEQPVAARKFKFCEKEDHFYHLKEASCYNPYETVIRKVIFQELDKAKMIYLPEVEFRYSKSREPKIILPHGKMTVDAVELRPRSEHHLPDILLHKNVGLSDGQPQMRTLALAIVPHGSIDRHVAAGCSVLELKVSRMTKLDQVAALLTNNANGKTWLHHAKLAQIKEDLAVRLLPGIYYHGRGFNIPDCPRVRDGEVAANCDICPYSGGTLQGSDQPCLGHNRPALDAFLKKYRDAP
ncbi:MAG: hypothetical protein EXR77_19350 [Myxococcales bacterium]|nr:hypothetical protein [Myxococcales bacterium]